MLPSPSSSCTPCAAKKPFYCTARPGQQPLPSPSICPFHALVKLKQAQAASWPWAGRSTRRPGTLPPRPCCGRCRPCTPTLGSPVPAHTSQSVVLASAGRHSKAAHSAWHQASLQCASANAVWLRHTHTMLASQPASQPASQLATGKHTLRVVQTTRTGCTTGRSGGSARAVGWGRGICAGALGFPGRAGGGALAPAQQTTQLLACYCRTVNVQHLAVPGWCTK